MTNLYVKINIKIFILTINRLNFNKTKPLHRTVIDSLIALVCNLMSMTLYQSQSHHYTSTLK